MKASPHGVLGNLLMPLKIIIKFNIFHIVVTLFYLRVGGFLFDFGGWEIDERPKEQ